MPTPFTRTALFAVGGLLVWAAEFLFLYTFSALACERGFSRWMPHATIAATLIAAGATIAVLRAGRRSREFTGALAAGTAVLALLAIAFLALPGLLLGGAC